MQDYLFNVGMSASGYVLFAIALIILIVFIDILVKKAVGKKEYEANKKIAKRVKRVGFGIAGLIIIWGLFISFAGPQRTYKNQTFDTYQEAQTIKRQNEADSVTTMPVIEDEQRPDKFTTEERQQRFDNLSDWRSGSKTGEKAPAKKADDEDCE